jgi:rod shape determining protein RodA
MNLERLHLDKPLLIALGALAALSLLTVYSASGKDLGVLFSHALRLLLGFAILLAMAQIRPELIARYSPHFYAVALGLLGLVLVAGTIGKGARRWLDLGLVTLQPAELMKLAGPMMLAWLLARSALPPRLARLAAGFLLAVLPAAFIARQPDLGTAALVFAGSVSVLFLAGASWRLILALAVLVASAAPLAWHFLHDYQRARILTLLDPESDPLGSGYHTIQSMIAVGSGGFYGKGWLHSTQAHLEYLPEAATDFIFAVFAEEFGLLGSLVLLALYAFVALRGMLIAYYAQESYTRLLAGGLSVTFFLYFFVNMAMVTGILPIVGVPLPIMSYGGSSLVTVMAALGILMSIHTHRKLVEH